MIRDLDGERNLELRLSVVVEAVLSGHGDWIYSVRWDPTGAHRLLSASMDKCVIVWDPDPETGLLTLC